MKLGSFFLREINRMTSSSRPGGTVSDSISVTNPCRYFCPTSASRVGSVCGLLAITTRQSFVRHAAQARERYSRRDGAIGPRSRKLGKRDVRERSSYGCVHSLPRVSDAAIRLEPARALLTAALRDRERSLECIEDVRGRNPGSGTRELIAAVAAAGRRDEATSLQFLQQLARRRQADAGALRNFRGGPQPIGLARETRQNHGPVVGQFADSKHGASSRERNGTILVLMQGS